MHISLSVLASISHTWWPSKRQKKKISSSSFLSFPSQERTTFANTISLKGHCLCEKEHCPKCWPTRRSSGWPVTGAPSAFLKGRITIQSSWYVNGGEPLGVSPATSLDKICNCSSSQFTELSDNTATYDPFEHYLGCKSYSTLILNNTKRKVALRKLLSHAGFDFNILLVWLGPRSATWVKRQGHRLGNTALDSILKLALFTYSGSTSGAGFSGILSPPNLLNFCFQANLDLGHNYNFFWEYIFWKKLALSGHFSHTLLIQK